MSGSHGMAPVQALGGQWIIDAYECDAETLQDTDRIREFSQEVVDLLGLTVLGKPQIHQFPHPHGVTALYLLSESHLAIHTYPEHQHATINVVCCRPHVSADFQSLVRDYFSAQVADVQWMPRGTRNASTV